MEKLGAFDVLSLPVICLLALLVVGTEAKLSFVSSSPQFIRVKGGESARFSCATNDPTAKVSLIYHSPLSDTSVKLFVDNKRLHLSGQVFTLSRVTLKDSGMYFCQAAKGKETIHKNYGQLFVYFAVNPADISPLVEPTTVTLRVGEKGVITCSASGWGFTLSFYKRLSRDGQTRYYPVPSSSVSPEEVRTDSNGRLVKRKLTVSIPKHIDHKEMYRCTLDLKGKKSHAFASVSLPSRPTAKIVPSVIEADIRDKKPVRIKCAVSGSPQPDIYWYKNGRKIAQCVKKRCTKLIRKIKVQKSGQRLKLMAITRADQNARFMCKASNPGGEYSALARLVVKGFKEPLKIVAEAKGRFQMVAIGYFVEFNCTANDPDAQLSLLREEMISKRKIEFSPDGRKVVRIGGILRLNNVSFIDGGLYLCRARRGEEDVTKRMHGIIASTSVRPDAKPLILPSEISIDVGSNQNLTCKSFGIGFTLSWQERLSNLSYQDVPSHSVGVPRRVFRAGMRITLLDLMIKNASHTGQRTYYRCTLKFQKKKSYAYSSVYVREPHPPKVSMDPSVFTISKEVHSVTLSCQVESSPRSDIEWRRNNETIVRCTADYCEKVNSRIKVQGKGAQLYIPNIRQKMVGDQYTCIARNFLGSDSATAHFVGEDPLSFLNNGKILILSPVGYSIQFNCTVNDPQANVTLLHSNSHGTEQELVPGRNLIQDGQVFSITRVRITDAGVYSCKAARGEEQVSVKLGSLFPLTGSQPVSMPFIDPAHKTLKPKQSTVLRCQARRSQGQTFTLSWQKRVNGDVEKKSRYEDVDEADLGPHTEDSSTNGVSHEGLDVNVKEVDIKGSPHIYRCTLEAEGTKRFAFAVIDVEKH